MDAIALFSLVVESKTVVNVQFSDEIRAKDEDGNVFVLPFECDIVVVTPRFSCACGLSAERTFDTFLRLQKLRDLYLKLQFLKEEASIARTAAAAKNAAEIDKKFSKALENFRSFLKYAHKASEREWGTQKWKITSPDGYYFYVKADSPTALEGPEVGFFLKSGECVCTIPDTWRYFPGPRSRVSRDE